MGEHCLRGCFFDQALRVYATFKSTGTSPSLRITLVAPRSQIDAPPEGEAPNAHPRTGTAKEPLALRLIRRTVYRGLDRWPWCKKGQSGLSVGGWRFWSPMWLAIRGSYTVAKRERMPNLPWS